MTAPLHIPWLVFARQALFSVHTGSPAHRTLQAAVTLADRGFNQPAWLSAAKTEVDPCPTNRLTEALRPIVVARDSAIRVALVHALTAAFPNDTRQGSPEDRLRHLCQPRPVPPGLQLNSPEQDVEKITSTLRYWEKTLDAVLLEDAANWPIAWNTGIAITALDRLHAHSVGPQESVWRVLLDIGPMPFPRFCARKRGLATCIPTSTPGLKVRLICAPWLAQLLQHGKAKQFNDALVSLDFNTKRMGDRSNDLRVVSTGLTVAHLYYAVLIERLYQLEPSLNWLEDSPMKLTPHPDLPRSLVDLLTPPERQIAALVIAATDDIKSTPDTKPGIQLKTRKGVFPNRPTAINPPYRLQPQPSDPASDEGPINLLIPSASLQYRPPQPGDEREGFGSVVLDADELDLGGRLQWMDMVLLILHRGRWFVLRPELLDDEGDEQRVHLAAYDELPQELRSNTSEQAIAAAMPRAHWAIRIDGQGGFVCAALSLQD